MQVHLYQLVVELTRATTTDSTPVTCLCASSSYDVADDYEDVAGDDAHNPDLDVCFCLTKINIQTIFLIVSSPLK